MKNLATCPEDGLSNDEVVDIMTTLLEEGFTTSHIALISVLSDPEHLVLTAKEVQTILRTEYDVEMKIGEIRKHRRNPRIQTTVARVFSRMRPLWMLNIEKNMLRTASDPSDKHKVAAAKLLLTMDGRLDRNDKRRLANDPTLALVKQINNMKRTGVLEIEAVTGRVTIRGSIDGEISTPRKPAAEDRGATIFDAEYEAADPTPVGRDGGDDDPGDGDPEAEGFPETGDSFFDDD